MCFAVVGIKSHTLILYLMENMKSFTMVSKSARIKLLSMLAELRYFYFDCFRNVCIMLILVFRLFVSHVYVCVCVVLYSNAFSPKLDSTHKHAHKLGWHQNKISYSFLLQKGISIFRSTIIHFLSLSIVCTFQIERCYVHSFFLQIILFFCFRYLILA